MDIFIDYLFDISVTSQMSELSSEEQHDNFARQLSTFEKILVHFYSTFSLNDLHSYLKLVLRDGAKNKGMLKIPSLSALQECIDMYKQTVKAEEEVTKVTNFFKQYFAGIEDLERLRRNFNERIYQCLYECYYDPMDDLSDEENVENFDNKDSEDESGDEENIADTNDLHPPNAGSEPNSPRSPEAKLGSSPTHRPETPPSLESNKNEKKQKNKSKSQSNKKEDETSISKKKKKRKRKDNRMKVLERIQREKAEREALLAKQKFDVPQVGKELEKLRGMSDRQKLSFTIKDICNIENMWRQLLDADKVINPTLFDEDSQYELRDYKNYQPFESVFRLFPDIFVKGFKLVELSKVWYNSARRLYGPKSAIPRSIDFHFNHILDLERCIQEDTEDIKHIMELKITKQGELTLLSNQIERSDVIESQYTDCAQNEHELTLHYQELKQERDTSVKTLEHLDRKSRRYRPLYEQTQKLEDQMIEVYNQLKVANYELQIMKQDYSVELETRHNLIRSQNDALIQVQEMDQSIPADIAIRMHSIKDCVLLKTNCRRMWELIERSSVDSLQLQELATLALQDREYELLINTPHDASTHLTVEFKAEGVNIATPVSRIITPHNDTLRSDKQNNTLRNDTPLDNTAEDTSHNNTQNIIDPQSDTPHVTPHEAMDDSNIGTGNEFNPSAAGIVDPAKAKDFLERVERLKKGFSLDLSQLPKQVDCEVSPRSPAHIADNPLSDEEDLVRGASAASGNEGDMDSDEEQKDLTDSLKKYKKRFSERSSQFSPLSDEISDEPYTPPTKPPASTPKTVYVLRRSSPKTVLYQTLYILKKSPQKLQPMKLVYSTPTDHNQQKDDIVYKQRMGKDQVDRRKMQAAPLAVDDINGHFIDSLSLYKKPSPITSKVRFNDDRAAEPSDQALNMDLSDGDISTDSGTGNSLNSRSDGEHTVKEPAGPYVHKSRQSKDKRSQKPKITVRQTLKSMQQKAKAKPSHLPMAQPVRKPKLTERKKPDLTQERHPTLEKSKHFTPAVRRSQPFNKPATRQQGVHIIRGGRNKRPAQILESLSDSGDEVFKQKSTSNPLPPKPAVRNQIMKSNRKKDVSRRRIYPIGVYI